MRGLLVNALAYRDCCSSLYYSRRHLLGGGCFGRSVFVEDVLPAFRYVRLADVCNVYHVQGGVLEDGALNLLFFHRVWVEAGIVHGA